MPSTYEPIASVTLSSAATSVRFDSIPATYTDLVVTANYTLTYNGRPGVGSVNFSTSTNRTGISMYGTGSTSSSYRINPVGGGQFKFVDGDWATQAFLRVQVMSYSNATTFKTMLAECGNAQGEVNKTVVVLRDTAAIYEYSVFCDLGGQFASGSRFNLYGIKAA